MQGQKTSDVDFLGLNQREKTNFSPKENALLDYVKVLTLTPADVKDGDVERLRGVGWTDDQIFEASFITALFAFFNRMADAYGLGFDEKYWVPPNLRKGALPTSPLPVSPKPPPK